MASRFVAGRRNSDTRQSALTFLATSVKERRKGIGHWPCDRLPSFLGEVTSECGDETQAGPEEQSPRDRSKGRMRHVTKYSLLEDCGKTRQPEWSSVTFWSRPCVPGEASRLPLLCEEKRTDLARWEPFRYWPVATFAAVAQGRSVSGRTGHRRRFMSTRRSSFSTRTKYI